MAWASGALAQATDLDSLVVTAQKRETKLIETPMSVTLVDRATLQSTNADDFADFARLVPGLSFTDSGPGNKRYALRGLQSAGEPEVALYYDEIPISGLPGGSLDTGDSQPDIKLWDVDRIEVLRGPQGTLYGNGAMGGAIRIISRRPDPNRYDAALQGSVAATDGGDSSWRLNGMVNLPIVADKLAVRLTAYDRHEGGWIDDLTRPGIGLPQIGRSNLNWEHTWGGRAAVSYQPTDAWNIVGIGYFQNTRTGNSSELYPSFATAGDRYVSKAYIRTPWRDRSQMYNVISTLALGWADFVTTASYQHREVMRNLDTTRFLLGLSGCTEFTFGATCTAPPLVPADGLSFESVKAWSAETRLVSPKVGRWQWTAGASFQDAATDRNGEVAKTDAQGYVDFNPQTGAAVNRIFARTNHDTFDQQALFGEVNYSLTAALTATLGLRWFRSDRSDQQVIVQQFFAGAPTGPLPFQEFKQDKVFQKYQLSYALPGAGLVYVQAAQGFRAGGPNFPGGFNLSAPPYAADSVWDYEAGWKMNLLQDRLYWSGAVFRIDWRNLQQLVPTLLFSAIANAGRARSDGFETEMRYTPTPGLTLTGGVTYNDARLVGPQPAQLNPTLQLKAGDKLANAPDWTAHGSVEYVRPLANGFTASGRVDVAAQTGRGSLVTTQNPAYFRLGGYTLVDAHLALDSGKAWRLALDVDNLFNRYAPLSGKALDSNFVKSVTAARPRTASLTVTVRY